MATNRLVYLLREGPVTIVPRAEDVYGRTVADVFVHGQDVAAELRREGFEKPEPEPLDNGPRPRFPRGDGSRGASMLSWQ